MAKYSESLDLVIRDLDESKKYHDRFRERVEQRYRCYRGILNRRSDAAQWTSKLHPPYIFQMLETMVANLIEEKPRSAVRPRPRLASAEEIEAHRQGAETLEFLLRYQEDKDYLAEKRRPFILQGLISGLTVGKNYWVTSEASQRRLVGDSIPVTDPLSGAPIGEYPVLREEETVETFRDDPTFEVVDVRDFIWHEAAPSLSRSRFVIHRVWMTFDELKELEAAGVYEGVDKLKESQDFTDDFAGRETELFQEDRTKDQIEVLEYWNKELQKVITVANRKCVLAERPFPFWHGEYPFVVCSSMPDLFRIPGISEVEVVEELQEALWTLMNQRIDNLQLINNAIVLIRSDVDDPDAFDFAPGEKWMVEDPDQVKMWSPEPTAAQISLSAEALIKGDIQNITGGGLFMSGTDSGGMDQETATGVSIVTSLAQKRFAAKKQQFMLADKRRGDQWIALLQQFVREPRILEIVGSNGVMDFTEITPEQIQGRYSYELEPATESLMRQERRAEAQALVQVAASLVPVMQLTGNPLNMRAFTEDLLDAFEKQDKERYFSPPQQAPMMPPGGPGSAPNAQGAEEGSQMGVTAPQAADASSPSNQTSLSPEVFMQRAQAMRGGGRNV